MPEILIAVRTGTVYINGARRMVRKGKTTAHPGHRIVTEHPKLWGPLRVDYPAPDTELIDVSTIDQEPGTEMIPATAESPVVSVRPSGGGWYEVLVDGEVVDKVRGEAAAQARCQELAGAAG